MCDMPQIHRLIDEAVADGVKDVVNHVLNLYKHARYQQKPTPASLRQCVRRECKKRTLRKNTTVKEPHIDYLAPKMRTRSGKGNASYYYEDHDPKEVTRDVTNHWGKPHNWQKTVKPDPTVSLKQIERLTKTITDKLERSVLRLKALNEEEGKLLLLIGVLRGRSEVLEAFNNDPQTLKILSWLNE